MAFLEETFVADDLPQSDRSYDLLPEGWYDATISKAEVGNTKAGTGTKIDVRYDITGPTQRGGSFSPASTFATLIPKPSALAANNLAN